MTHEQDSHHASHSSPRNRRKAVLGLIGLLRGMTADRIINDLEALYLRSWLENNRYLSNDPDSIDLYDSVSDILADGRVDPDEQQDLITLATDIANHRKADTLTDHYDSDDFRNEFLAYLQGINADNIITLAEARALQHWLDSHPEYTNEWPMKGVKQRIYQCLADNHISQEESDDLSQMFKSIAGCDFLDTGMAGGLSAWSILEYQPDYQLQGKSIAFTGTFSIGARSFLKEHAITAGATVKTGVSKQLDALYVGSILTPDWMFTSHGRKIQQALDLKDKGHPILLLCEDSFVSTALPR
ncbi:BRCT domain-containing protein [uncultured Alcanivorax sp.]|uniref:BRCT domain-containing protein n=1 Tax=uncultured Alcanivorax sp. TaxID=191215 RepID=UPI0030DC303A